jgi:hypothetical protein
LASPDCRYSHGHLIIFALRLQLGPVTAQDLQGALAATKPSARLLECKYQQFSQEYGQVM